MVPICSIDAGDKWEVCLPDRETSVNEEDASGKRTVL